VNDNKPLFSSMIKKSNIYSVSSRFVFSFLEREKCLSILLLYNSPNSLEARLID